MPISAPGACRGFTPPQKCGFTLLELLVVMLIIGLFAGLVATITRPDERALLRLEAERLAQLLDLATVESRLTGRPVAWTADAARYQFWRWREDAGWIEAQDDALRARSLPPGMAISDLRIETMRPPGSMRLEFAPGGSLAYEFQMSLGAARYSVAASPLGEVQVHDAQ